MQVLRRSESRRVARKSSGVPHARRPGLMGPAHVTLKLRRGLPKLRTPRCYRVLERAFRAGMEKKGFLLCQFSVQDDHLHLIVEANSSWDLTRGMQGLVIRIAKALNRHWRDRHGPVFAER